MPLLHRKLRKERKDLAKPPKGQGHTRRRRTPVLKNIMERAQKCYICDWCRCETMSLVDGEWIWHGQVLKLQIDHIHGCSAADSDEAHNLRWLCPNCHSQTHNSNYAVKSYEHKRPKSTRPYKIALLNSTRKYECANCQCKDMTFYNGYWHWRDWPLKLECNHINGRKVHDADALSNLEWLCPNCHFQHSISTRGQQLRENWKKRKA